MVATRRMCYEMPDDVCLNLRNYAFITKSKISDVLSEAVTEYLENHPLPEDHLFVRKLPKPLENIE